MAEQPWNSQDPETLFDLVSIVDEGSTGAVWKAERKDTKEPVAVKIVPLTEDIVAELKRETHFLEKTNNKYIVNYHGSYEKDDQLWIVMELCEGGSLNDLMYICEMDFTEEHIRALCAAVLIGLNFIHSQSLIHRDIKAKNVLLTSGGAVKLADFGVAAEITATHSKRKTAIGSPHWMAPEVILSEEYDHRADIWSLGIMLIELAQKEPPMADLPPLQVIFKIPSSKPAKLADKDKWSEKFHKFLKRCLQIDPSKRPSAQELLHDPFVAKYIKYLDSKQHKKNIPILRKMMEEQMPQILWFREQEESWRAEQPDNDLQVQEDDHIPLAALEDLEQVDSPGTKASQHANIAPRVSSKSKATVSRRSKHKSSPAAIVDVPADSRTTPPAVPKRVPRASTTSVRKSRHDKDKTSTLSKPNKSDKTPPVPPKRKSKVRFEADSEKSSDGKHRSYKHERRGKDSLAAASHPAAPTTDDATTAKVKTTKSSRGSKRISKHAPKSDDNGKDGRSAQTPEEPGMSEQEKREKEEAMRKLQARLALLTEKFDADISGLKDRLGGIADIS